MDKIGIQFIINQYEEGASSYTDFTTEVGLWESEKYVFKKYLSPTDHILDLGCGTGRTTFSLYQMGYQNIKGIDITPGMIREAQQLNSVYNTNIPFEVGDARKIDDPSKCFDSIIFSFNGLMSIPQYDNRFQVLQEVHRLLRPGSTFIFTTHDRNKDERFFAFWEEQKRIWDQQQQNPQLYEFGDIIASSKNEPNPIFIHIPDRKEVEEMIDKAGFQLVETFYRDELFDEPEAVKIKSGECRFWIVKSL